MPDNVIKLTPAKATDGGTSLMPVEVRGLSLEIKGKRLIHSLNLNLIGQGITVIMGPNGAGKSLLLRLLHGLIAPTSGQILMGGAPMSPELIKRQAMVFQQPVLLRRSVAANVDFVLKSRGNRTVGLRQKLLEKVGLADKADLPARLLSGGEQQRLALARALATSPEMLLLDEPTASLDPASAQVIETIVREADARGTRIIFVSHDIGQARRLADNVVFLADGQVNEHGCASTFFDTPKTEAAKAYVSGRLVL